jgi:hypothetical protein
MAVGTDSELMKKEAKKIKTTNGKGGRPKANEDLIIRLLKATTSDGVPRYTFKQISKSAKCTTRTVKNVKKRALADGRLKEEDRIESALNMAEADFDEECIRAKGYSFLDWLDSNLKNHKPVFSFCEQVWNTVWERPSLVDVMDHEHHLGDKLCMEFLKVFGEDKKRLRNRKKTIRYIFRFLGRGDLCDNHLRMTKAREPVQVRRVPEISMIDFPEKFEKVVQMMEVFYPKMARLILYGKIAQQVRTGDLPDEREFWGLKKGSDSGESYIIMSDLEHFRIHYMCKSTEHWNVQWLPYELRKMFWERYNQLDYGDQFLKGINVNTFRKRFGQITKKIFGRNLILHDLRKVSITWFFVLGIRLEIATVLNVGWKDLNTPRDHYLEIGRVLKSSYRQEYADKIPDWFKDGLDEFMSEEAFSRIMPNGVSDDS